MQALTASHAFLCVPLHHSVFIPDPQLAGQADCGQSLLLEVRGFSTMASGQTI